MLISIIRLQAVLAPAPISIPRRVWHGIRRHFVVRFPEWWATAALLQFGWILYAPPPVFDTSPNLAVLAQWATEEAWGAVCLAVGAVHLLALIVNGSFPRFPYSPHVRAFASFLACGLWFQVTFGIWLSGIGGTGFGTYRLIFLLEVWNLVRACQDTGKVEGRRGSDGG
ncbi:hypothetical protein MFUR16E_04830 [Methylobacterium fujisawaense]